MERYGEQNPTYRIISKDEYFDTLGEEAVKGYEGTGRTAQPWQNTLMSDIMAINEDGLWVHSKVGYSVPRRNGKSEILMMRDLYALEHGEKVLHTAHRTSTSSSASVRLVEMLDDKGYTEVIRVKKDETYDKHYTYSKQFGLEKVTILGDGGGSVAFRTRTSKGGLGEGYDVLIIDEAQEYTDDQQSTLQYVVSDSANPQIVLCGTPPTAVSAGTVFPKLRESCINGETEDTYWAEWSVEQQSDVNDVELWYKCNPAMGFQLNERKVRAEDKTDEIDFNIQRLGLWIKYNQKSAISEIDWKNLAVESVPKRASEKVVGIKYSQDGTNVALSIAFKTPENKVFVECVACRPLRSGNAWIIDWLTKAQNIRAVIVDGAQGQQLLASEMKKAGLKPPILPTVKEIIVANSSFEQNIFNNGLAHRAQPSVVQIVTNCDKRTIGSNGGFGYKSLKPDIEIAILDSIILAQWGANEIKAKTIQRISY